MIKIFLSKRVSDLFGEQFLLIFHNRQIILSTLKSVIILFQSNSDAQISLKIYEENPRDYRALLFKRSYIKPCHKYQRMCQH